jgi:glycosyltransferase involved in cell wall biosynthesis
MIKKKILFLDHTPFVGGAQISLIQHMEKINKEMFDVIIVCSKNAEKLGLTEQYDKIKAKYHFISFGRLKSFSPLVFFKLIRSALDIRRVIKMEKADLIFGNTVRADIAGSLASLLTGTKIIWFIQDYTFPKFLFNLLKLTPKKIFYVSKSIANHYSVKINDKNIVMYIWRNFYQKADKIEKKDIRLKRGEWRVNENVAVIGYIGRLVDWKGPQVLIEAIEILLKKGIRNIKCLIIGTGGGQKESNEKDLKRIVEERGLGDYVFFAGYQKDIPLLMSALDIFCLTSIEPEPFSSVVVEAMMAKIPVIGAETGGTPEILKNEKTGLLVNPNNAVILSNAIERLINNGLLRKKLTENAYNYVMKYNTADYATKKLEREYFKLLKR